MANSAMQKITQMVWKEVKTSKLKQNRKHSVTSQYSSQFVQNFKTSCLAIRFVFIYMSLHQIELQTPQHTFILSIHDSDKWLWFCWSDPLPSMPFLLRGLPFRLREEHPGTETYSIFRQQHLPCLAFFCHNMQNHFTKSEQCNLILSCSVDIIKDFSVIAWLKGLLETFTSVSNCLHVWQMN